MANKSRPHGSCEPGIQFVEREHDLDRPRVDARQELIDTGEIDNRETCAERRNIRAAGRSPRTPGDRWETARRRDRIRSAAGSPPGPGRQPDRRNDRDGGNKFRGNGQTAAHTARPISLSTDEIERQLRGPAAGNQQLRLLLRVVSEGSSSRSRGRAVRQRQPQARQHLAADRNTERLQRRGRGVIFRGSEFERPYRDVAAESVAAGDLPVELAKTGVKIGTPRDRAAFAQCRVAKDRLCLDEHHRRRRREIMGNELFQQVLGKLGEFVLELELHSCCKKGGSLQEASDQGSMRSSSMPPRRSAIPGYSSANWRACSLSN